MAGTITSNPVPRQTIPYGDRPFVDAGGKLTFEAYQFLQRLVSSGNATVQNVGTVINQSNAQSATIVEVQTTIESQSTDIANIESQLATLSTGGVGFPPPAAHAVPIPQFPPAAPQPMSSGASGASGAPPPAAPAPRPQDAPPPVPRPAVLPSSLGGTDNSAPPQDGQLLIGNTAEGLFNLGTITAGANVTITNAGGGITIAASGTGGGGISTIVAGAGLTGGTITSSGTIALGTIAAASLFGNSGTVAAVPTAIAIGANLTLAGGTLSASGGGGGGGIGTIATGTLTTSATESYLASAVAVQSVPAAAFPTWINQQTAALSQNADGSLSVSLTGPNSSGVVGAFSAVPAGSWTLLLNATCFGGQGGNSATPLPYPLILSDGTKLITVSPRSSQLFLNNWSTFSTVVSTLSQINFVGQANFWWRVAWNSVTTTLTFSYSQDGWNWAQFYSTSTPYLTPTLAGFGMDAASNPTAAAMGVTLNYWSI